VIKAPDDLRAGPGALGTVIGLVAMIRCGCRTTTATAAAMAARTPTSIPSASAGLRLTGAGAGAAGGQRVRADECKYRKKHLGSTAHRPLLRAGAGQRKTCRR